MALASWAELRSGGLWETLAPQAAVQPGRGEGIEVKERQVVGRLWPGCGHARPEPVARVHGSRAFSGLAAARHMARREAAWAAPKGRTLG